MAPTSITKELDSLVLAREQGEEGIKGKHKKWSRKMVLNWFDSPFEIRPRPGGCAPPQKRE